MGKTKFSKRLGGRIIAWVLACAMVLTSLSITPVTAAAADSEVKIGPVKTPITSIKYTIEVSGVKDQKELSWKSQDNNWAGGDATIALDKDKTTYDFTVTYSSAAGLKNMGWFVSDETDSANKDLQVVFKNMLVNGAVSIDLGITMYPNRYTLKEDGTRKYDNAIANIWGGYEDGVAIYGSKDKSDAFFAYSKSAELIRFYTIGEIQEESADGLVATGIDAIEYNLTVSGINDEKSLTWSSQDGGWSNHTVKLDLEGDGDYTLDAEYDSISGFKNMGFFAESDNEDLTITVKSMKVNGKYTIDLGIVLKPGVADENGKKSNNALKNIWGGFSDGDKVYAGEESYFGYDGTNELICFYAPKEEEVGTGQSAVPVKTDITSIEYIGTIAGAEGAGSFDWTAVTTANDWGQKTTTVDYTGNGKLDFMVDFSDVAGSVINLGYITVNKSSKVSVTIDQIVINDYYTLDLVSPATLQEAVEGQNGLINRWGIGADCVIAQDSLGQASLKGVYGENNTSTIEFWAPSVSQYYVLSMGDGWNLGNSFDAVNTDTSEADKGEEAWGNPVVTRGLIAAVKAKGYDSIRMPMTLERRYSKVDGNYVIDTDWLARYKEVVDYATELGLHVMINMHHDSWSWLANWDGKEDSEEYVKYTQLWTQLAEYFKDESYLVSFETINEPYFEESVSNLSQQKRLDAINLAAYNIIRNSGGKNDKRIIVMPTLSTNAEKSSALYKVITGLNDPYVVATVHYYSEWVFSANLGRTGFDEDLFGSGTARDSVDTTFASVYDTFTANGIGVVVGEYGLLGYDAGEQTNQAGEELKYYDYVNYVAKEKGICLMFWDNGSGIDRTSSTYNWKKAKVGAALEAAMKGERSSYATGLDTIYLSEEAEEDVSIPLTLNGNTFTSVADGNGTLTKGTDYTYDEETATLTLTKEYVNKAYVALGEGYGQFADLTLKFSAGADWHEYLVKYGTPEFTGFEVNYKTNDDGTKDKDGYAILADFKGAEVRRVTAYQASGKVGPNSSWWDWLQKDSAYATTSDSLQLLQAFFDDSSVKAGDLRLAVEMYDGQMVYVLLNIAEDGTLTFSQTLKEEALATLEDFKVADTITLYEGETEIPAQYYLNIPDEVTVSGGSSDNANVCTVSSNVAKTMKFAAAATDETAKIGLTISKWSQTKEVSGITLAIKKAPAVSDLSLTTDSEPTQLSVGNLADDAECTYEVADTSVATVSTGGVVTVVAAGETTVDVTVTQYGRTDTFTGKITVAKKVVPVNPGTVIDPGAAGDDTAADGSGDATEEIPTVTVTAVKKGTVLTDKTSKAKYKVTSAASAKTHTVTYVGTTSSSKKSITIPATVKIGGVIYKVTAIAANAFKKNTKLTSVTIGKNVKTIGKNAFYGCTKLKSVTFKSGIAVDKIAAGTFAKCTSLKKVTIPASVKSIDSKAFYGCTKLSKVTFAKNSKLSTVKKNAFSKCTSLKKLTLPKKAKSVK